jgi:hypothetical protein
MIRERVEKATVVKSVVEEQKRDEGEDYKLGSGHGTHLPTRRTKFSL